MAQVYINQVELEHDILLPNVCMRCGAPADGKVSKTFAWYKPGVPFLIFLLFGVGGLVGAYLGSLIDQRRRYWKHAIRKRAILQAPMCQRHRNHWKWRSQVMIWGLLGNLVVIACILLGSYLKVVGEPLLMGFLGPASLAGLVAWIITTMILLGTAIRAEEVDEAGIALSGVNFTFVRELQDYRYRLDKEEEAELAANRERDGGEKPAE